MKLTQRLEPDQRELDGVFAVMCVVSKMTLGMGTSGEGIDEPSRADGAPQRRDVIAPVEIPFQARAMTDAEDQVIFRQRLIEKGLVYATEDYGHVDFTVPRFDEFMRRYAPYRAASRPGFESR